MRQRLRATARCVIDRIADAVISRQSLHERTSPAVKAAMRALYSTYRASALRGDALPSVWETGFRNFSQFDEDGIVLFLLAVVGTGPATFVDIGAGDGVWASNCANLALNFAFHGLCVDADAAKVEQGRRFYATHPDTAFFPPKFAHAAVTRDNVNAVIRAAEFEGQVDVLSIDIDGNDYWIWEAIDVISARVVVVESHVEFGTNSIVVPYDAEYRWRPGMHPHYLGASPVAMTKLAHRLGYRLVGANRFGFNLFYLRNDVGADVVPAIEVQDVFRHHRNKERMTLFEPMKGFTFETV